MCKNFTNPLILLYLGQVTVKMGYSTQQMRAFASRHKTYLLNGLTTMVPYEGISSERKNCVALENEIFRLAATITPRADEQAQSKTFEGFYAFNGKSLKWFVYAR
jgi:hypothetical protein